MTILIKDNFKLREIAETDLEIILNWRNSDRVRLNMFSDHIISVEEHLRWFQNAAQSHNSKHFIFEHRENPVGVVNFTSIDRKNNICYWGFYLGSESSPAGSGMVMGYLGLEYAFQVIGIRKICSEIFAFNSASVHYHKKLGFIEEGVFKDHILKNEKYEDVICMAHFIEHWLNIKNDLIKQCWR